MTCHMRRLVHALRDGRLAIGEIRSAERHIAGCGECRAFKADLERLAALGRRAGELPTHGQLEHRRRRLDLLRAAATPPAPRSRRAHALAFAAALIVGAALWLAASGHESGPLPPSPAATVGPVDVHITPAPRTRFERSVTVAPDGTRLENVQLEHGSVAVDVAALGAGQRFVVATRDAEVEVRGTRFSVHAEDGRLEEVLVYEGTVEVRRGGEQLRLVAGTSWAAPPRSAASVPPVSPSASKPPPAVSASGPPVRMVATAPPRPTASGNVAGDFAAAMSQLEAGDYARASDALRTFAGRNEDDPRSEDARFLVIVAMQRAGRHADAARAAREYLARHPRGARRAEAATIAQNAGNDDSIEGPAALGRRNAEPMHGDPQ